MKKSLIILVMFISLSVKGQDTWYGEIALYGGGGTNDIFRFNELEGAGSYTGTGMWTGGIDLSRIITDHFSIETGIGYAHQYYYSSPAPGIPGDDRPGNFGMISVPVTARLDFLKFLFADAGILAGLQTGSSEADDMTGLGFTAGVGVQYRFKSDILIRLRVYGNQYALLHFAPENYPQTLYNSGVTLGIGYRFIHLGDCNCPERNTPRKRFY
jgi:opacity protein-like surface antigen